MIAIFLDCEATGLDFFRHRMVELAYIFYDLEEKRELYQFSTRVYQPRPVWEDGDPESQKIHGLHYSEDGLKEAELAQKIEEDFRRFQIERGRALYICQNPSFDRTFFGQIVPPMRQEELHYPYHWLDLASMYFQYQRMRGKQAISVSKNSIAKELGIPPEALPHRAITGVRHLIACFERLE